MRFALVLLVVVACGDNSIEAPPDAPAVMFCEQCATCESLGCSAAQISLECSARGGDACTCDPDGRGPAPAEVCRP